MITIKGTAIKGGGYSTGWMPEYFPELFPGTLNCLVNPKDMPTLKYTTFVETKWGKRPASLLDCKINGEEGYIILPPIGATEVVHKEVKYAYIELAATFKIRDKFNIQDGDSVEIQIK